MTTLSRIEQLFDNFNANHNTAILKLRYAVGEIIKDALDNNEYKTISDASGKIADSIHRRMGATKGAAWFRKCWLMATRLSESDRELLLNHLNRDVKMSDITTIVEKSSEDIVMIMKAIREKKFKGLLVRKRQGRIFIGQRNRHCSALSIHNGDDIWIDGFTLRHYLDWQEQQLTDHLISLRAIVPNEMYERCDNEAKVRARKVAAA